MESAYVVSDCRREAEKGSLLALLGRSLVTPVSRAACQMRSLWTCSALCREQNPERFANLVPFAIILALGKAVLQPEGHSFCTMKENDFPKSFLLDEEANEFKPICRSSYPKKIWELLLQQSTMLWHNIKSGIKNTVSRIKSLTFKNLAFILFFLLLSLVLILLLQYNEATSVVPVKGDNTETIPKVLTVTALLDAKKSKPFCEAMKNCFDTAVSKFKSEPQIVKDNTKMILECNGTREEFMSGKGENYIQVFWVDGQTYYMVKEANSQVYAARLGRQPLNLGSLLNVYQQLVSFEGSEVLRQCLNKTIEQFPKEPHAVQDNAVLQVSCGGSNVTFHSEAGENEINVYKDGQGEIVFNVKAKGWARLARLFRRC